MDFHSLSRRELQAFCKRNKIPANMTNAAMADALKALEIVEGIEEFMQQPSQSESAQSSIELLDSSEVTSPYVPPTAGRSTRRRNVLKDDVEAVASIMTTTRRTTRKTTAKASNESQVDAMETQAVVQASRRKVQMASACPKVDSQLKECIEEEKKDVLMTPAAVGVASRRRRAEDMEKKVYSTRRSTRLAVKSVQMLSGAKSEGSELSNNQLFAKDCEEQEVNQKEGLEDCNELSGTTGVESIGNMEEDKENFEVVSAEKVDIIMGEMELGSPLEEDTSVDFAVEVQPDEEICDDTEYQGDEDAVVPVNVSDEVQQSEEGPVDVPTCEIEVPVENSKEVNIEIDDIRTSEVEVEVAVENSKEVDVEIDAGSKDEARDFESEVDAVVSDDEVEVERDDDKEVMAEDDQALNVTLCKLTLQQEADSDHLGISEELKQTETETIQVEESEEEEAVVIVENSPSKLPRAAVPVHEACLEMGNKKSASKPLMTGFSDKKRNVGSGTELVIMKDSIKPAKDFGENLRSLEEESLRKLTKMLKEKLQISNKSSKHGTEALQRSALQVLPENQLIEGNGK